MADGFDVVSYLMGKAAGGGGGGGGIVLSGNTDPSASIGNDEDLYIKYTETDPSFDHLYAITGTYRKVNGVWVAYTDPVGSTAGVHIYASTGSGTYLQQGSVDGHGGFIPNGDPVYYTFGEAKAGKDVFGLVHIETYNSGDWFVYARASLTDGTNNYSYNNTVAQWKNEVDITVWEITS